MVNSLVDVEIGGEAERALEHVEDVVERNQVALEVLALDYRVFVEPLTVELIRFVAEELRVFRVDRFALLLMLLLLLLLRFWVCLLLR